MKFPRSPYRVVAIDPGTRFMGYAILHGPRLVTSGVYRLRGHRARDRLDDAERWLLRLISEHRPQALALERTFSVDSARTALLRALAHRLHQLGLDHRLVVRSLPPTMVRRLLLGKGHASKDEVMEAIVTRHFPRLAPFARVRLPLTRRYWQNMFDAIAVGLAFRLVDRSAKDPDHRAAAT
jgi:crossover junction endodeoxyribonuclease RuvC